MSAARFTDNVIAMLTFFRRRRSEVPMSLDELKRLSETYFTSAMSLPEMRLVAQLLTKNNFLTFWREDHEGQLLRIANASSKIEQIFILREERLKCIEQPVKSIGL
jgi:hypothetical protein